MMSFICGVLALAAACSAENVPSTGYSVPEPSDSYGPPAQQYDTSGSSYSSYEPEQYGSNEYYPNNPVLPQEPFGGSLLGLDTSLGVSWLAPGLFLAAGVVILAVLGVVSVSWLPITPFQVPFFGDVLKTGSRAMQDIHTIEDVAGVVDRVETVIKRGKKAYEELFTNEI